MDNISQRGKDKENAAVVNNSKKRISKINHRSIIRKHQGLMANNNIWSAKQ